MGIPIYDKNKLIGTARRSEEGFKIYTNPPLKDIYAEMLELPTIRIFVICGEERPENLLSERCVIKINGEVGLQLK